MAKTNTSRISGKTRAETPASVPEDASSETVVTTAGEAPKSPRGKLGAVVDLLHRPEGATLEAITKATGWQTHSVRSAMSGSLKKRHGLNIVSETTEAGRIYRIAAESAA